MEKIRTDCSLFVDIIKSEGVELDYEEDIDGFRIGYFIGLNKKVIPIRLDAEFIYNNTARSHMRQLGIDDLILRLFPYDDQ